MPKFTFKCEHLDCYTDEVESTNTIEFTKEYLFDVIEEFERFLRGSGFHFEGEITIVDNSITSSDDDIMVNLSTADLTSGDSDFIVAGSVEDYQSIHPFSFDTMISGANQPDLNFSINTDEAVDLGVIYPEGNNEGIVHFRV